MTYCVALKLRQGMIFLADTRTNAGLDNISRVKKLFTWKAPGERALVMLTAGNLGVTQAVVSQLEEDIAAGAAHTMFTAPSLFHVAELVGDTMRRVQDRYGPGLRDRGEDSGASVLLGGQRKGGPLRLFHVYAAGNFIEATPDTPYFQIGEHKYGKPIIDRVITEDTDLRDAVICALLSMDSTLRSNLSVGMPLDLAVMREGDLDFCEERRIEADDPEFRAFSEQWSQELVNAFSVMRKMTV